MHDPSRIASFYKSTFLSQSLRSILQGKDIGVLLIWFQIDHPLSTALLILNKRDIKEFVTKCKVWNQPIVGLHSERKPCDWPKVEASQQTDWVEERLREDWLNGGEVARVRGKEGKAICQRSSSFSNSIFPDDKLDRECFTLTKPLSQAVNQAV